MPYEARRVGEKWEVVNTETQEVKTAHEGPNAEITAKRQVRILTEMENDNGEG